MNKLKKIIGWIVFFIIAVFVSAMFRGHRLAEQRKANQFGTTEVVNNNFIKTQLTEKEEKCTSIAWTFKQFASFRDAGMSEKDVYTFITNGKSENTKIHMASALSWIYKDRASSTPEGIAIEVAAACVKGKMPDGLIN